jgi:PAS domain S-box-containing protein
MYYAVNKGFTQLFGYTEEEVVGKTSKDIDLWVDYAERNQFITTLKNNGYVENYEIRLKGKDQQPKAILISSIFIDIDGELCILTDSRDISDIKRSQEDLRKSEALLNEVGYIAKIGGWEYSPVTGESSWTEEVARIHDLDPKTPASVGRSLNYYTEQSRPVIEQAFKDCVELAQPYDLELEIFTATSQPKWIRTIGRPIVENGKVVKVHGAFQDITEAVIARQELIQAKERAEAGDKVKTAFINNISHEIRTPLNGIMGFSQIIIDPYFPLEDKVLYGQWLNESCERLMTTVTNIMDVSLLTSGNYIIRKNQAPVITILQRAGEGFSFLCQNRNLVIHIDSEQINEADSIFTDENIVSRILFQLVDNAVKFTEKGTITLSASKNHAAYQFKVSDTGIGISEEFKSQIYDFFTQIDNSVTRKYEGTGIGLSIAKGFVDLLGGNIWVESEKGKGTSFFVTIPVN